MNQSECPISFGAEGSKIPDRGRQRHHARLVAPIAQEMLTRPFRTPLLLNNLNAHAPIEAPGYSVSTERPTKILLDPLIAVLSHKITMDMLSNVISHPESFPLPRQTDQGILAPSIKELHTVTAVDPQTGSHNAFVRAMMERVSPSFESVLTEVMPYTPVWQAFATLVPEWFDSVTTPEGIAYHTTQGGRDPVNRLHTTFWEGASTLPTHAEVLAPLIYSDDVKTVGQFQRQALDKGVVRFLAQGAEVAKTARNKTMEGENIPVEHIEQDTQSGILNHGTRLAKGIEAEVSWCAAFYGLLDPRLDIRKMCRQHNEKIGSINRSSSSFNPVLEEADPLEVVSSADVLAYFALLLAPSILWRGFLESKGITDWSDALPGTSLPQKDRDPGREPKTVFVRN